MRNERSASGLRQAARIMLALALAIACTGCAQLLPRDSKVEAKERWSNVRAKLKLQLASESFSAGQFDQAQKHLDDVLSLNPHSGEAFVLEAKILLEKGETASASEALDEALRHGTDTAETDYLSGVICQRYEKLEDALTWYQRSAQREPMDASYVVAVAETLVSLGRAAEALQLVQSKLTDFEQNATLRALAGGIHMMLGDYEKAADSYREAARIAPDDEQLRPQLGVALTLAKKYQEAKSVLTAAGNAPETPASVLSALGRCRLALNEAEEAKKVLRRAVDSEPGNARNWALLAQAAVACEDLLTARRAAIQATQLQPENRDYRLILGYVCGAQKDYPSAIAALEPLGRNSAGVSEEGGATADLAIYLLAQNYRAAGNPEQVRACLRKALDANPQSEWARGFQMAPLAKPPDRSRVRSPRK